mgnify:CR=1 FL=1
MVVDNLDELKLSSDPKLAEVQPLVQKFAFGDTITAEQLRPILSMTDIFGADLYKAGLADRIAHKSQHRDHAALIHAGRADDAQGPRRLVAHPVAGGHDRAVRELV